MWNSGLSEHPLALWCPSQLWGRDWLGSQHRAHRRCEGRGRHSRRGAWMGADGDGEQCPADLSGNRWPSCWPGREAGPALAASHCSHSFLFLLNLYQKAPVQPSGAVLSCTEVVVLAGGWGISNTPPSSPGHDKILLTQEPKLREMKQLQKINLFSILFSIFFLILFSAFLGSCMPSPGQENKGKA